MSPDKVKTLQVLLSSSIPKNKITLITWVFSFHYESHPSRQQHFAGECIIANFRQLNHIIILYLKKNSKVRYAGLARIFSISMAQTILSDPDWLDQDTLLMAFVSSGSFGCGAIFGSHLAYMQWPQHWSSDITYFELIPVV